jgi:hypothetical protein
MDRATVDAHGEVVASAAEDHDPLNGGTAPDQFRVVWTSYDSDDNQTAQITHATAPITGNKCWSGAP